MLDEWLTKIEEDHVKLAVMRKHVPSQIYLFTHILTHLFTHFSTLLRVALLRELDDKGLSETDREVDEVRDET